MNISPTDAETIDISDIKLEQHDTCQEMSALVDGERIWFRFPLFLELEPRAELFMAPAMIEAMVRGLPVRIPGTIAISRWLARNFEEIQSLLKSWNDDFTVAPVQAEIRDDFPATKNVICCFSGGIDSTYTYGKYRNDITHLLLMQGFDDWQEGKSWKQNVANRQAFADAEGKKLITVETNIRHFCEKRKFDYNLLFGNILTSVGIIFNPELLLVPSSFSYSTLHPLGSHPLLDPLWATENTRIIHHGCALSRCEKTRYIAEHQDLLDQIQVCWESSSHNCGACSKCLRTSLALKILGRKCRRLVEQEDWKDYDMLAITGENALAFMVELILLCHETGNEKMQQFLEKKIRNYRIRRSFHNMIKFMLGKAGRILSRRLSNNPWYGLRAPIISNKIDK